jgi:hypothetical protein
MQTANPARPGNTPRTILAAGAASRQPALESIRVTRTLILAFTMAWFFLAPTLSLRAGSGKVALSRKYRAGQKVVYQTKMQVQATVESNPPGLKSFLPPVPTRITARQQNTVTVREVHPDGSADVETRFDTFEFESDLVDRLPESTRDSARAAQEEFSSQVAGQTLKARYDTEGKLLSFEGADRMLQQLDPPLREPLKQVLRLFLEQMGGNTLYPDHPVKPGEEWTRKLSTQPSADYPFAMQGESTLQFAGKTKYRGVKAAIIDFKFTNVLWPELEGLRKAGPLAQLESSGLGLDIRIDGKGNGRVLVALKDGRVLQNRATLHQEMSASLKNKTSGAVPPAAGPITLQIKSETALEMEGSPK